MMESKSFFFSFIVLNMFHGTTFCKNFECTTSGHRCSPQMMTSCHQDAHLAFPIPDPLFAFGGADYCPDTHIPPLNGPSGHPGEYPCRPEDGYYRCPLHYPEDNCVRRSLVNSFGHHIGHQPCAWYQGDGGSRALPITCSDHEAPCPIRNRCVSRRDVNTRKFGCRFDTRKVYVRCHNDEFRCASSGRCLPRSWVRDGSVDCSLDLEEHFDSSDEEQALAQCDDVIEFRCRDESGRCIPRDMVMNGMTDCPGGSDEYSDVISSCHRDTEFRCNVSGRCLPRYRVNDGFPDCTDGSDEDVTRWTCHDELEFECVRNDSTSRCIPRSWVGNNIIDCVATGADEVAKESGSECRRDEIACASGSRCIPLDFRCDGIANCDDCSDEIEMCDGDPRMFRCRTTATCIPWSRTCDRILHCPDGSDERTATTFPFGFKCPHQDRCHVPQFLLYDDTISMCDDRADRCFTSDGEFHCARCLVDGTIISTQQLCDGVIDCADLSDECRGACSSEIALCDVMRSRDNVSIVCNGVEDLPDAIDERYCVSVMSFDFQCTVAPNDKGEPTTVSLQRLAHKCDGDFGECRPAAEDECSANCANSTDQCEVVMNCGFANLWLNISRFQICDGVDDCESGADERNCSHRHQCDAGLMSVINGFARRRVSVSPQQRCDLHVDCRDGSDEIGCNDATHFYCTRSPPRFVPATNVIDGRFDCVDHSDECPPGRYHADPLSSNSEMVASVPLLAALFLFGVGGAVGNGFLIQRSLSKMKRKRYKTFMPKYWHRMFLIQLALSNTIAAVSALLIFGQSVRVSGRFCAEDWKWRSSSACRSLVGALNTLAMVTSINMIVMETCFVLVLTFQPLRFITVRPFVIKSLSLAGWIVGFVLSIIPSAGWRYFSHELLLAPNPYFRSLKVNSATWNKFEAGTAKIASAFGDRTSPEAHVTIEGYFSFYSVNPLCFPPMLSESVTKLSSQYSRLILTYVTVLMTSLPLQFGAIKWLDARRKARLTSGPNSFRTKSSKLTHRKRIAWLVMTRSLLWLPVLIMTVATPLRSSVCDVITYVVVIASSALDPFVYQLVPLLIKIVLVRWRSRAGSGGGRVNIELNKM